MRPRTILVTVAVILALGIGGRVLIWAARLVPGEHDDLKQATELRIRYGVDHQTRALVISDPPEVKQVLATLAIDDRRNRGRRWLYGGSSRTIGGNTVEFVLPRGPVVEARFVGRTQLNRSDRGTVFLENVQFYEILMSLLAEHEGKRIDLTN
jgi:hypothetical protein